MEWSIEQGLVAYPDALARMEARVRAIQAGEAEEWIWLVEHPPLYTAGTSAKGADLLGAGGFPVYETGRGGQYTYHGPGQRVVYLMLDLKKRAAARGEQPDLRAYVKQLEAWIIATLAQCGVEGFIREGRVGVWVEKEGSGIRDQGSAKVNEDLMSVSDHEVRGVVGAAVRSPTTVGEAKIAALGVRVQKWVTSHGIAINVNPDLRHYAGIVPCGIRQFGVTSLAALGVDVDMAQVDAVLRTTCPF